MESRSREIFSTGIPSFDTVLGGGIPRRQTIIVAGDPGSGKTILCSQVAALAAARGVPAIIATVTSEPHEKLVDELMGFDFFDHAQLGEKLQLISIYAALKKGAKEARDLLVQAVRDHGAKVLFIDGLRSVRDLWQNEARLREFLYELGIGLAAADCVGLWTTEYQIDKLLTLPEATTVDGIVSLSVVRKGARRLRRLEVVKLRGRNHLMGEHLMRIGTTGVEVLPRLETQLPDDPGSTPSRERAAFDLPEFDALLGGGLPVQSTTLLAGSMGIGKTLLAAHFAAAGARRGEKTLFVSFFEPPEALAARAERTGVDLHALRESGALRLVYLKPGETEADLIVHRVRQELASLGARRLVIDGLTDLEQAISDHDRRRAFLAAFAVQLRLAGVTTLFTKEVSKIAGTELDFSDTPVAVLGENLVLLRHVELRGRLHRILSILKMRDSEFDGDVREFQISNEGIRVLSPIRSAAGLLTGQARPLGHAADEGDV